MRGNTGCIYFQGKSYVPITRVIRCDPDGKRFNGPIAVTANTSFWTDLKRVPVEVSRTRALPPVGLGGSVLNSYLPLLVLYGESDNKLWSNNPVTCGK